MRIFLTWLRRNYTVENIPPLALWSECQRRDFWRGSVWKTSTARASELLFGQILHSSLQWILKIRCRCNKCLTFSLFLTLEGRWRWPVTFQLVIQVVSDVGQVLKKTVSLYFGFFFFLSFLHWAELEAVTMQPFQISAPGTVPMHFSVSLLLSCLLLLHPPPPPPLPHLPPASLCLSDWREGWLTRLQQCSLIISLHHSDKPQPHIPSNLLTPSMRHTPLL